jgi:hypothetical protein
MVTQKCYYDMWLVSHQVQSSNIIQIFEDIFETFLEGFARQSNKHWLSVPFLDNNG